MTDLTNPKLIWLKGLLFLVLGIGSAALLLADSMNWRTAVLLGIVIWAFCRAYYFAFYVIEHYVDSQFRFAGLIAFARYVRDKQRARRR